MCITAICVGQRCVIDLVVFFSSMQAKSYGSAYASAVEFWSLSAE